MSSAIASTTRSTQLMSQLRRRRPAEQQDRRYYQIGSGAKYSTDETIGLQMPETSGTSGTSGIRQGQDRSLRSSFC